MRAAGAEVPSSTVVLLEVLVAASRIVELAREQPAGALPLNAKDAR
jgi:hypothetical protein